MVVDVQQGMVPVIPKICGFTIKKKSYPLIEHDIVTLGQSDSGDTIQQLPSKTQFKLDDYVQVTPNCTEPKYQFAYKMSILGGGAVTEHLSFDASSQVVTIKTSEENID